MDVKLSIEVELNIKYMQYKVSKSNAQTPYLTSLDLFSLGLKKEQVYSSIPKTLHGLEL